MDRRTTLAPLLGCLLLLASLPAGCAAAVASSGATTPTSAAAGPATSAATANASVTTQADSLDQRFVLALSPEPGEIRVRVRYRIPDDVTSLRVSLPAQATVRSTEGFRRTGDHAYDWTQSTQRPSIAYDLAVNRTVERGREGSTTSGYIYVDAGDWAIAPAPSAGLTYSGFGQQPPVNTTYGFDTPGATGGDMVYLGPHEERTGEIANQRLRLIVPRAADMAESPSAVFASVGEAAKSLDVGPRDEEVVAIAAPRDAVQWGSTGLQRGESDFWVLDGQRVSTPANVWVHEYVHTRQVYEPTNETRWTVEAAADYYAALSAYRQGRIDYASFRNHLEHGRADRYEDVVLADPSTWRGTLANYDKGGLVMAALDRRIRLATDGGSTLQGVIRRLDDGEVSQSDFLSAVEAVGGADPRAFAKRHTETTAAPETWSRREHRRAFGSGAEFSYAFSPPYDRRGPYREDRTGSPPSVVTGETLTVPVTVENVGSKPGEFQAVLSAGGETVATRTGRLDAGGRTTVTFERTFRQPGQVRLTVGAAAETVTVRRPADVTVTALETPRRVRPGGTATVRATVASAADRPADGTVNLTVDGERVAQRRFTLPADGTGTLSAEVTFERAGEYAIAAGGRSRTVTVAAGTPVTPTPTLSSDGGTGARGNGGAGNGGASSAPTLGQPGFGLAAGGAAAALSLALALLGRRP